MNNRNFIRLVYRKDKDGVFVRSNGRSLHQDFPFLPYMAENLIDKDINCDMFISKVKFFYHGYDALAWIDKHDNVIVRYMSNHKQTKINF